MPKMRELAEVDAGYATTGPNQTTLRQAIPGSADALFRCLEDGPAWKRWLGIEVHWTSPRPFGVGTTRTVKARGNTIEEYFTAWEPGRRMAFRFERTTLPMAAFAEDYVIEATGDNTCELAWSHAYDWGGPLESLFAPLFGKVFVGQGRRALRKLAKLIETEGAAWA